eukprot:3678325-Rhodomonas_salina.1
MSNHTTGDQAPATLRQKKRSTFGELRPVESALHHDCVAAALRGVLVSLVAVSEPAKSASVSRNNTIRAKAHRVLVFTSEPGLKP